MATDQTKVAIFGDDPVVGRALETLLQDAGYRAWSLSEFVADDLGEQIAEFHLLLIVPPLGEESRRVLQAGMLDPRKSVKIAILELISADGGERLLQRADVLLWPCSQEELKRTIDSTLTAQR
jgi:hypothetical protein